MNGYKIVLLKAILCFIGCRKVNGYAPEYVDPEMFKILILLSEMGGIHFLIVQKSRNGSLLIHSTGKLLSMLERGKTFFHDIIRANLHCIKDAMLLLTFVSVYCQSTACIL